MLKAARTRARGLDNVDLRKGDLRAVPVDVAACDAALLVLALSYVEDVPAVLSEAARILKPGGRLVVVDLLPHDRDDFRRQMGQQVLGFEPGRVETWLREAGFGSVAARPLPPEPQAKGPALFVATGSIRSAVAGKAEGA
jgi:ArsR family transcriptional regulator